MFKGKCFQFKDLKAKQKFIDYWQGQDDQQKAVAEFIDWQPFSVTICTPKGGIRAITRLSDGMVYYTDLPEALIDQCEIMLFFDEVEFPSLSGSDKVDYAIDQAIKLLAEQRRDVVFAVIKNLKPMSACAVIANIISCEKVSNDNKCWIVNAIYNEAHKENK